MFVPLNCGLEPCSSPHIQVLKTYSLCSKSSMSGVSGPGSGLAEAYVMRKLHKEKMKRMAAEKKREESKEILGGEESGSVRCLFWGSKKKVRSVDSATKAS
ncbi:uncharacterized protein LOC120015196 isoform X2 [Tripterygium wilfordii]|nr:uncharacterized protein LOC120015196 isoform X2 [Tripterygium wilfordii]